MRTETKQFLRQNRKLPYWKAGYWIIITSMLTYLAKVNKSRLINHRFHLNDKQASVLDYVSEKYLSNKICHVTEITLLKTIGSLTSLHTATKRLVELKLIKVTMDPIDNRLKNVVPTPLALKRLEALVAVFESA